MALLLLAYVGVQDVELRPIAEAVARRDYATAEALSLQKVGRDPSSALAWFYLGHARAAVGRYAEAVDPLQKAVDLGLADPKARFQLGHSAHRAGRHDAAVPALRETLRLVPGHDEARYDLGVSLLELGKSAEAVEALAPLAVRDGPWRALARYQRGLALRALGREKEAAEDFQAVAESAEDAELRRGARERLRTSRAWSAEALVKAGYDSNVLLLPETSLSRGSEEGAAFLQTFLTAEWDPLGAGAMVLRGSVLDVRYDDLAEADIDALLGEAAGRAAWSEDLAGRLVLRADTVRLGHDPFFHRGGPEAAIEWRASRALALETGALWLAKDFRDRAFDDLDGSEAEAWVRAYGPLVAGVVTARAAYRLLRDDTEEDFLDARTHRLEVSVSIFPAEGPELRLDSWAAGAYYGAEDPATSRTRRDLRVGGRASALWPLGGGLRLLAEAEVERSDSSVSDFDYTRAVGSVGATLTF